jgi:hypothetical protein
MAEDAGERRELRSIFRAQALEHHRHGRWTEVLPLTARPRVFRWLWVALGVLGLLLAALAAVPAPTYGAGSALAVAGSDVDQPAEPVALVVALPVSDLSALTDGAPVVLQQGEIRGSVARHEPNPLPRAELTSRFGLPAGGLPDPAAVAVVRLEVGTGVVEIGSRYPARVRVGSRSMLAGLPLLGRLFG